MIKLKKYGLKLSEGESIDLLNWFKSNENRLTSEEKVDEEIRTYLYSKYAGRPLLLMEEDLSNMKYLLTLLKKQTGK